MDPTLEVAGTVKNLQGPLPDLLTDDAISFIKANRDEPFAVCLHFRAPHLPYGPVPPVDSRQYEGLDPTVPELKGLDIPTIKRRTLGYYASISSVDRNIGRLLSSLDELELAHNTLVMFTSDHGYNEGRHYINTKGNGHWVAGGVNGPKRPNMWDTSIRIPMAFRWPAVIQKGRSVDAMVSNIDMFRTILGALSVPLPDSTKALGRDFSSLLRGETAQQPNLIFGQYDLHNSGLAYLRMLRTDRYKYVRHFHSNFMDELYDLKSDPDENTNLLRRRRNAPADLEALEQGFREQLTQWMKSIEDPLLDDRY